MRVIYPVSSLIYSVLKLQWLCGSLCHFSLSHSTGSQNNSNAHLCFLWSQRINEDSKDLRRSLGHPSAQNWASYGVRPGCSWLGTVVTSNPPRMEIAQLSEELDLLPDCPHKESFSLYPVWNSCLNVHLLFLALPPWTSVRSLPSSPSCFLCSLWGLLGELDFSLLQADPAQLPQSLLTGQVLHPPQPQRASAEFPSVCPCLSCQKKMEKTGCSI